ncbi:MAG: hypothetical protein H7125_03185, partial [Proteobacteria bacterium]|nr:hypothetical protein [Burkholderiales bacterium]
MGNMIGTEAIPFAALGKAPPMAGALVDARASWVAEIAARAQPAARTLQVPTPRDEAWRFTDLGSIARQSFMIDGSSAVPPIALDQLEPFMIDEARGARLVFVDGVFAQELSSSGSVSAGVRIEPLSGMAVGAGSPSTAAGAR